MIEGQGFFKDRRKYPRFELNLDAKYKILDYEQVFQFTRTRNISAEGVCFESGEVLKLGIYVQLEVDLKDVNPPVSMVAEIKWVTEANDAKDKKYINGVKIISMPGADEARFLKYYCGVMVEKLSAYLK
ncbi:MAG: PilZ domain-containing protein [Candidatus Omnitrophota bacterium]|nr:PilZ domain-containing protein [Candidatus Omnitrophota bacterium]